MHDHDVLGEERTVAAALLGLFLLLGDKDTQVFGDEAAFARSSTTAISAGLVTLACCAALAVTTRHIVVVDDELCGGVATLARNPERQLIGLDHLNTVAFALSDDSVAVIGRDQSIEHLVHDFNHDVGLAKHLSTVHSFEHLLTISAFAVNCSDFF